MSIQFRRLNFWEEEKKKGYFKIACCLHVGGLDGGVKSFLLDLRGEKLNYKSVAKEI